MTGRRTAVVLGGLALVVVVGVIVVLAPGMLRGGRVTPTTAGPAPHFVDETASSGLDHAYTGDATYATGGGLAAFDCTGDGRPELYVAGGSGPAALYRNDSAPGGALKFTRIPDPVTDLVGVNGAYPVDIDGDGNVDLVVLQVGGAHLLRGLGGCRFAPADTAWSFDGGGGFATAFSASWEGASGLPTLAIGNYLKLDTAGKPTGDCATSALVRPAATGGSGYGPPMPIAPGYCTLSMLFSDWDRSGRRDLRVTNDRQYYTDGMDQLWRVAAGEAPRAYTASDGWVSLQIWGMGIASYDLTGDGYPEVYLTSQADNKLQTLTTGPSQPTYRDIALKRGVTGAQPFTGGDALPSTAWHPDFQDVNNDGFIDLFVSKGNVNAMPDYAAKDPSDLFLGRPDGTFVEGAADAGIVTFDRARGAVVTDLNADGLPDLVVSNFGVPARVWRNVGAGTAASPAAMGHWLDVTLAQTGGNRDAIGSWVDVRIGDTVVQREVTVGGGHISGTLVPMHVGLGPATAVEVRVQWPDGETGPWLPATADQRIVIERGAASVRPAGSAQP
jgi:hypothetical protein